MIIINQTRDSIINFDNSQTVDLIGQSIFVHFDQKNEQKKCFKNSSRCSKMGTLKSAGCRRSDDYTNNSTHNPAIRGNNRSNAVLGIFDSVVG